MGQTGECFRTGIVELGQSITRHQVTDRTPYLFHATVWRDMHTAEAAFHKDVT